MGRGQPLSQMAGGRGSLEEKRGGKGREQEESHAQGPVGSGSKLPLKDPGLPSTFQVIHQHLFPVLCGKFQTSKHNLHAQRVAAQVVRAFTF